MTIRSGRSVLSIWNASCAVAASLTRYPCDRSRNSASRRLTALSSTSKIFSPAILTLEPLSLNLLNPARNWQREEKPAAFANLALHPDPAAVHLHKLLCQRQAESASFGLFVSASPRHLSEFLENSLMLLSGDAGACVSDLNTHRSILGCRPDPDLSGFGREFDRVAHQVQQNLL